MTTPAPRRGLDPGAAVDRVIDHVIVIAGLACTDSEQRAGNAGLHGTNQGLD